MASLPEPFSPTEKYLSAVLEQMRELNQRIATMQPRELVAGDTVELREPGLKQTAQGVTLLDGVPLLGGTPIIDVMQSRIPDDFPGQALLADAGIHHYDAVPRSITELTKISGIGPATAKSILESL